MITTAADANSIAFRTRLFGFDKTEVRNLLSNLLSQYERALSQVEALKRELNARQDAPAAHTEARDKETAHTLERIVSSAHRVAEEVGKTAEQEAAHRIAEAEADAARIIEAAATEAAKQSDAAASRLRQVEEAIERMQVRHHEVKMALESIAASIGLTLADMCDTTAPTNALGQPLETSGALESFDPEGGNTEAAAFRLVAVSR